MDPLSYNFLLSKENDDIGSLNKRIRDYWGVSSEEFNEALDIFDSIGVDTSIQSYFMCECISEGKELKRIDSDLSMDEIVEQAEELAENCVPYQTYLIYRLWIEFGYETEGYEDIGIDSIQISEIFSVAQYELHVAARKIILHFASDK